MKAEGKKSKRRSAAAARAEIAEAADATEAAAEDALTAECASPDAGATPADELPAAPPLRQGETAAHLLLKRLALFWAQKQGYHSCAFEVSLPNSRYRADLAAYMPSKGASRSARTIPPCPP